MIQKFVTQQIKILNKSLFLNYDKRDKKSNNYISITPITWKVGRANKKVVVLCIKHPQPDIQQLCKYQIGEKY